MNKATDQTRFLKDNSPWNGKILKIPSVIPLYDYGDRFVGWHKGVLSYYYDSGEVQPICKIPLNAKELFLTRFRISERLFRLFPRFATTIDDRQLLLSFHGRMYKIDLSSGEISVDQEYIPGMNNPLSIAKLGKAEGFRDCLCYGEYTGKREGVEVAIWKRDLGTDDKWEKLISFPKNQITHIHAIIPDPYRKGALVLTGDEDSESGIWLLKGDTGSLEPIVRGHQQYRSCFAIPTENGIFYATDTPLENNKLYHLVLTEKGWVNTVIHELPGSVIYGTIKGDYAFFSCSVEPDSRKKGIMYHLINGLGPGIKDRFVRVFMFDIRSSRITELYRLKKDKLPPLFQFGTVRFAEKCNSISRVVTYQIAVRKYDGYTFVLGEKKDGVV